MTLWLRFLTTDTTVLGVLSWASALVTVAGFWIAIAQIRRTRSAAEAAARAATQTDALARQREKGSKLNGAISQLKIGGLLLQRDETLAASAYLETAFLLLVETKELSREDDRSLISSRLVMLRQFADMIQPSNVRPPSPTKKEAGIRDLRAAINALEEMAARLRYTSDV